MQRITISRRAAFQKMGATGLTIAAAALAPDLLQAAEPSAQSDALQSAKPTTMKHDMSGYNIPTGAPQQIAMVVYPGFTALDLVGPNQILAALGNIQVHLVAKERKTVLSDTGIPIQPTMTFADCPHNLTVLFVPGGLEGTITAMGDTAAMGFLANRGKTARYVTSVCTGSLLLGAAGLVRGYRATSHWTARDMLPLFGATPVRARFVEDRNRITGAGVTAGIDFALHLTTLLRNEKYARAMELTLEYDPHPPYHSGTPEDAKPDVLNMMQAMYAPSHEQIKAAALKARKRWL